MPTTFGTSSGRPSTRAPSSSIAVVMALVVHVVALATPFGSAVLRIEPIPLESWGRTVIVAFSIIVAMEVHKALRRE